MPRCMVIRWLVMLGRDTNKPRPVRVNGKVWPSSKSAANYICDLEGKNYSTVCKEIRNCQNGKRPDWLMYGKYMIERVK